MKMRRGMSRLLAWALCFALLLSSVPLGLAETNFLAREHDHSHDGQCVTYYYGEDGQLYRYVEWIEGGQVVSAESQVAYAEMEQLREERERAEAEARAAAEAAARKAAEQAAAAQAAAEALEAARQEAAQRAAEEAAQKAAEEAAQKAAEEAAQKAAEEAAQKAAEEAAQKAAEEAAQKAAEEAAQKAAEEAAQKAAEEAAQKAAEEAAQKAAEEAAQKAAEEKKTEAVEEKKTEPVEEKKAEPIEEKKTEAAEEPKTEAVEEKKTEPVEEPKTEAVEEPKTEAVEEPKTEAVEEKKTEAVEEKTEAAEEPKAEETETAEEPKAEETETVEAKPATLTAKKAAAKPLLGAKPLMQTIGGKQESAEEDGAEPATQERKIGLGAIISDDAEPCENDERALRETRRELAENPNYTAAGASGHTADYDVYKAEYCIHCWHLYKDTEKVAETVPVEEPHVWKDGVCSLCGYACEHAFADGKCTVCGMAEPEQEEEPCEHEFVDGVCTKCGYACEHAFEDGKCTVCGMAEPEKEEEPCEHEFVDGVCTKCEYVCEHAFEDGVCTVCGMAEPEQGCTHPADSLIVRFVEGSEDENGEKAIELVCGVCGETLKGDGDANANNGIMPLDALGGHLGGTCTTGGAHNWKITSQVREVVSRDPLTGKANAAAYHKVVTKIHVSVQCTRCTDQKSVVLNDESLERHVWGPDGVCMSCKFDNSKGAATACKHERKYLKRWMDEQEKMWSNPDSHGYIGRAHSQLTCVTCGMALAPETADRFKSSVTERHHLVDGVCTVCGYQTKCEHKHTEQVTSVSSYEQADIKQTNADVHTYTDATIFIETVCKDCKATLGDPILSTKETWTEAHHFVSGVCTICGYVRPTCKHPSTHSYTSISLVRNMHSNGWKTHSFCADETTYTICNVCGECVGESTQTNKWFKKDHIFGDGKYCIDCGEKKPKSTSTTKKTATPAPTATPVPANPFEMVKYMMDMVDQTLARDRLATFEIVGASDILTPEEYAKLQTLSVKEQLLVVLASVGLGTDVDLSVSRLQLSPTQAERNLSNEIYLRMYRLGTEEKAALNALMSEYFPIVQVTENGRTYDYFTITLVITANGQTTTSTYGFRYDTLAREWVFITLTDPTATETAAAALTTALPLPTPAPTPAPAA